MRTPYLARTNQNVVMAFEALEIVYCENEAAVEGLDDRNGYRQEVLSKVKSVSWRSARTKGKGQKYKLTK